ncbi:hypothetical protein [Geobacter sp. SVR]|uniref:hypothetical protein n=1 Tax=Geobacter sp. SVR TaxID=2495594 RepID=UPI00143EFFC1|nr:hypothetical protein [Geobacter sp. SVR]BCS54599.1 hypothetical protein GSVR_29070 [Geobacter sp. SVR]GCF86894.1 hypothetical protein GSbR_34940 [Geobacter sp. SVR]
MYACALLLSIVLVNITLFMILIRLHLKHGEFFRRLVSGDLYGHSGILTNMSEFILNGKYAEMNDRLLTTFCRAFVLSLLLSLTVMVVTFLHYA